MRAVESPESLHSKQDYGSWGAQIMPILKRQEPGALWGCSTCRALPVTPVQTKTSFPGSDQQDEQSLDGCPSILGAVSRPRCSVYHTTRFEAGVSELPFCLERPHSKGQVRSEFSRPLFQAAWPLPCSQITVMLAQLLPNSVLTKRKMPGATDT